MLLGLRSKGSRRNSRKQKAQPAGGQSEAIGRSQPKAKLKPEGKHIAVQDAGHFITAEDQQAEGFDMATRTFHPHAEGPWLLKQKGRTCFDKHPLDGTTKSSAFAYCSAIL